MSAEFFVDTGAASLQPGALSQLQGLKGCVADTTPLADGSTCTDGRAPRKGAQTGSLPR